MRNDDDKNLRNTEIRLWFFALQRHYLRKGMGIKSASDKACEEIAVRFCLKKETVQRYKNEHPKTREERERCMAEAKLNLSLLKKTIEKIELEIGNE